MLKKTINYLIFSILSSGIGVLTTMYMARTVSQEAMGVIGLFMAVLYIAPQLVSFASTGLISINKVKLNKDEFIDFSQHHLSFSIVNFIIIFVISIVSSLFFKEYWQIFVFLPIIAFFMYIMSFHQAEQVQEGNAKEYGIYNLYYSVIVSFLTILLISIAKLNWDGRLLAMVIAQILIVIVMYYKTFTTLQYFKFKINKEHFKEFIAFGIPLMFGLGAGWVLNQADNYIVLHFFSLKEVGIYAVACSIGTIVNTINQAATNAIVPTLYAAFEKKEGHKVVQKLNLYYSIIIIISLSIGMGSYWYMPLVFGEEYAASADVVFFISLAFGFNGIYRTTGGVIAFYKQNILQMKLIYLSAVVNVIVSISLIPIFGLISPAIGTLVAYVLLAYTSYYYGWKILKKEEQIV